MSADFGYINARVRGMKSKLLGPEFYVQAVNDSSFRAFVGSFAQTPYGAQLEEAQGREPGLGAIDRAIAENFRRSARAMLNFSDGRAHELIAIFLLSYDLMNLKALARAKHAGRSMEDVRDSLMPAGELKPALLETLGAAADLPAMAQALAVTGHSLSPAFGRATRRYAAEGSLLDFEVELDKAYYGTLLEKLEEADASNELLRHAQRMIDAVNLSTALKVRGRGTSAQEYFLPGGKEIDRSTFDAIAGDTSPGALQAVASTSFAAVANTGTLSEADQVIRENLDRSARRLAIRDPLGPGVVLDYLRRKENETARLRLLARGKYYDVPREQLEKELGRA